MRFPVILLLPTLLPFVIAECSDGDRCPIDLYPGSTLCTDTHGATGSRCTNFGSSFCCPVSCGECNADPLPPCDSGFRCSNGHCINSDLTCDGINHCSDGGDENDTTCPSRSVTPSPSPSVTPNIILGCRDGSLCSAIDPALLFSGSDACTNFYVPDTGFRCQQNVEYCCYASCGLCVPSATPSISVSRSLSPSASPSPSRYCTDGAICDDEFLEGGLFFGSQLCLDLVGDTGTLCQQNRDDCCPVQCGECGSYSRSNSITPSLSFSRSTTGTPSVTSSRSVSPTPSPSVLNHAADVEYRVRGVSDDEFTDATVQQGFVQALGDSVSIPVVITYTTGQKAADGTVNIHAEVSSSDLISSLTGNLSRTDIVLANANARWSALGLNTNATGLEVVSVFVTDGPLAYACRDDDLCSGITTALVPGSTACQNQYQVGSSCSSSSSFCCPVSCGQCVRSSVSPSPSRSPAPSPEVVEKSVSSSSDTAALAASSGILSLLAACALCYACVTAKKKRDRKTLPYVFNEISRMKDQDVDAFNESETQHYETDLAHGLEVLQRKLGRDHPQPVAEGEAYHEPLGDTGPPPQAQPQPEPQSMPPPAPATESLGSSDTVRAPMRAVTAPPPRDEATDSALDTGRSSIETGPGRRTSSNVVMPEPSSARSAPDKQSSSFLKKLIGGRRSQIGEEDFLEDVEESDDEGIDESLARAVIGEGEAPAEDSRDEEFRRRMLAFAQASAAGEYESESEDDDDLTKKEMKPSGDSRVDWELESQPTMDSATSEAMGAEPARQPSRVASMVSQSDVGGSSDPTSPMSPGLNLPQRLPSRVSGVDAEWSPATAHREGRGITPIPSPKDDDDKQ